LVTLLVGPNFCWRVNLASAFEGVLMTKKSDPDAATHTSFWGAFLPIPGTEVHETTIHQIRTLTTRAMTQVVRKQTRMQVTYTERGEKISKSPASLPSGWHFIVKWRGRSMFSASTQWHLAALRKRYNTVSCRSSDRQRRISRPRHTSGTGVSVLLHCLPTIAERAYPQTRPTSCI
jgi:hypothetical protein